MTDLAKIEEIYYAALERSPGERTDFLREVCGADENLRREVEELLKFDEQAADFIETPPGGLAADFVGVGGRKENLVGRKFTHYRILAMLGAGGMGEVYLAEDARLGRKVALKLLPAQFAASSKRRERFEREARAASALNHPNIITIHEIGVEGGINFISTEFIEGDTLFKRIKNHSIDAETALEIAVQIASALDTAHRAGIVHRDIKPENIMIRPDGLVKVLDFGIAKLSERHSRKGDEEPTLIFSSDLPVSSPAYPSTNTGIIGTASYMSPEQAKGKKIDARTDIFSFGIVFYEMLTGRRAFSGETSLEIISSILRDEPVPLRKFLPDISPEFERISAKMLRKNADERYQTAGELLSDLKKLQRESNFFSKIEDSKIAVSKAWSTADAPPSPTSILRAAVTGNLKRHKFGAAAVSALLLIFIGAGFWFFVIPALSRSVGSPVDSIAVLPFQNVGGNANDEFLGDGIAETLINNFTKIPELRITARSTAFRYRGRESEPQTVGRELGVQTVLTGKITQQAEVLSIQVDLISASDGTQIFGNRYDGKPAELLDLQQSIVRDVAARLNLSGAQQQQAAKKYTESSEAYEFYLRGQYQWNKRTGEGLKQAIREFKQAADRDPKFALALVGIADCYILLEEYTGMPSSETIPQAKAFATRALELDESLGEAHVSLGQVNNHLRNWTEAERNFKRAIELNPNYSTAHFWYGTFLRDSGRLAESLEEIKRAYALDPLSSIISVNVGIMYLVTGDADSAVRQLERLIALDPDYATARSWLGLAYLAQGKNDKAFAELQKGVELSRGSGRARSFLACALAKTGKRSEAAAIAKDLEEKYARREATILNIAVIYAALDDKDRALSWLEKSFNEQSGEVSRIRWYPYFDALRGDSRFQSLLERMSGKF